MIEDNTNLDLLTSRELLIYIEGCAKKGDEEEMMRAHRFLLIREGENPDDFTDLEDYYEPSEEDLTNYSKADFETLNSDELMSVISNREDFYSNRESKKALKIFIKNKKANPGFSEHESDLEWAESIKITLNQTSKINWFSMSIPFILPFGFLYQQLIGKGKEPSTFNLSVFVLLLILAIGYSIREYKKG